MEGLVVAGHLYSNFDPAAATAADAVARDEAPTSVNARPLIGDLCLCPCLSLNHPIHRQDPPPNRQPPHLSIRPHAPAGRRHTIEAISLHLRLSLTEVVVRPRFPFPTGFRFWLHKGFSEQWLETLWFGARAVSLTSESLLEDGGNGGGGVGGFGC